MKTLFIFSLLSAFSVAALAGDLNPTDPPGSTMKTLDQVEPRIPIPGSDTWATSYTISQSGSYYLTGNRKCSLTGIQVDANDVTIDLMGYSLIGSGAAVHSGISMQGRNNVEVRNGTIRGFIFGIYEDSTEGQSHRIINIRAISNKNYGITLMSYNNLVKDCTVSGNGSGTVSASGLNIGRGSMIVGNTVFANGNEASGNVSGIGASFGSTVAGNTVFNNGQYGGGEHIRGIYASSGCTLIGNMVYGNGDHATSTSAEIYGIQLSGSSLVDQNTSVNNGGWAAASTIENMNDPGSGTITASNYAP